jgi:RimJ/RimL family protein N-acetyltransferase
MDRILDVLEGPRLTICPMRHHHLKQMQSWRPFRDPLHRLWNIPRRPSLTREAWFVLHSSDPTRLWFAVERRTDQQLIGSITLREMVEHSSARLGISLGSDYVDQGYGSEALGLFVPYFFEELDFTCLLLDVAGANVRARHVYEKLGFQYAGRHYRDIPDQENLFFLQEDEYRDLRMYFRRRFGRWQLQFCDMKLERGEWRRRHVQSGCPRSRPARLDLPHRHD